MPRQKRKEPVFQRDSLVDTITSFYEDQKFARNLIKDLPKLSLEELYHHHLGILEKSEQSRLSIPLLKVYLRDLTGGDSRSGNIGRITDYSNLDSFDENRGASHGGNF